MMAGYIKDDLNYLLCLLNHLKFQAISDGREPAVIRRYVRLEEFLLNELERYL